MSEEELAPLLESKICIPAEEKNMISRDSLIQRLEKSEEDVIVFWAGAGFGKTALMAEFARRHSGHCGWYRINELDENPHNFLQGIRLAVSKAMGTNFNVIKTRELEEDVGELYRKFLSGFLLRLREHVFYICFDDFQTIENECVYKFIESLIEYGRGKIRLMFAVKGDFPRFLAAHLMRQRVLTVCARHMQFDGKETGLLLNKITGKELPGTLVERIHEYTRGWPAGVVFAGIGMKNDGSEDRRPFYFDESYLYDYIFCEIFRKLPADIQKFLAETSVLGEMDAKLCDCALGRSDSEQILEYLARENLFISKQKGRTTKYSYAFVFSDFLSSMLKKERKEQIIYQASEYYARRGDWDRSFPYAQTYGERQVLQIKCLGQFSVKGPSGSVAFRTRKTRELFACLFFEEGRGVKRDTLMERLWPETDRERASTLFYTTVSYLRRALDKSGVADLLVVENQTYALNLANVNSDLSLLMNWSRYAGAGHIPENANIWEIGRAHV